MAKKDQIVVMLPPELAKFVRAEAVKKLVPISFVVRQALEQYRDSQVTVKVNKK